MEFLLLLNRSLHIMCVCVWLGGAFYQRFGLPSNRIKSQEQGKIFAKISHISLILILISGIFLMVSDSRFSLFSVGNSWSVLLLFKQMIFILIIFLFFGYIKMLKYLGTPSSNGGYDERAFIYKKRLDQYQLTMIMLGIIALIFGVAMHIYG